MLPLLKVPEQTVQSARQEHDCRDEEQAEQHGPCREQFSRERDRSQLQKNRCECWTRERASGAEDHPDEHCGGAGQTKRPRCDDGIMDVNHSPGGPSERA